jgi:hypothetical protein
MASTYLVWNRGVYTVLRELGFQTKNDTKHIIGLDGFQLWPSSWNLLSFFNGNPKKAAQHRVCSCV